MSDIFAYCSQLCQEQRWLQANDVLVVAVSGGVDSLVLLHLLHRLQAEITFDLQVATLDHGLRGEASASDADYVTQIATDLGLKTHREKVDVNAIMQSYGLSLEEAARAARYSFLLQCALKSGARNIALAHHLDDQAETVLMHFIRGSGLHGLQGMSMSAPLSDEHLLPDWDEKLLSASEEDVLPEDFRLIRPLLHITRHEIEDYAATFGIEARQDQSNFDTSRLRNTIRHDLLPMLHKLNPNIKNTMSRLAHIVQADVTWIDTEIDRLAAWLVEWSETAPLRGEEESGEVAFIDRQSFAEQQIGVQRRLIRKVIFDLFPGMRDLSFDMVERVRDMIHHGKTSAILELPADIWLRVGYDEVLIGYGGDPVYPPNLPHLAPGQIEQIALDTEIQRHRVGKLELHVYWVTQRHSQDWYPPDPLECTLAVAPEAKIQIRTFEQGDRFRPFGLGGKSQKLSDTFVNAKIPVYYREQVPLLTIDGEIAWFVAPTAKGPLSRIADPFAIGAETDSILRFRWQMPNLLPLT